MEACRIYTLTTLTEQLGCTVLQMTATRPHILPGARELLDRPERTLRGTISYHHRPKTGREDGGRHCESFVVS